MALSRDQPLLTEHPGEEKGWWGWFLPQAALALIDPDSLLQREGDQRLRTRPPIPPPSTAWTAEMWRDCPGRWGVGAG